MQAVDQQPLIKPLRGMRLSKSNRVQHEGTVHRHLGGFLDCKKEKNHLFHLLSLTHTPPVGGGGGGFGDPLYLRPYHRKSVVFKPYAQTLGSGGG